ncbi:hypothetical protein GTW69_26745 [Streptomyces sp. SID7760]|nr:hypothetical protein [Streptomyces sp. SID7760]
MRGFRPEGIPHMLRPIRALAAAAAALALVPEHRPRDPDRGRMLLDGVDITRRSPVWRARHGMRRTFQRQQLFGQLSVAENLLVAQEWRGGGGGFAADLAGSPARRRRERDPPRVLLLDEPASGLSAAERERLAAVVRRPAGEERCAVLLVEHDVAFVMDLCTRVVVLDLGAVLASGAPAVVRADPRVREAYLGPS